MVLRKSINNEKIIELYGRGWSINDIVKNHKTSVRRVRELLNQNGISTSDYRKASEELRNIVLAVVAAGVPLNRTATILDISVHLVRQVLRDNQRKAEDLRKEFVNIEKRSHIDEEKWNVFYDYYLTGSLGFLKCAQLCGLDADDCVALILRLSDAYINKHKIGLRRNIIAKKETKLSAATIATMLGISPAIVKETFYMEEMQMIS